MSKEKNGTLFTDGCGIAYPVKILNIYFTGNNNYYINLVIEEFYLAEGRFDILGLRYIIRHRNLHHKVYLKVQDDVYKGEIDNIDSDISLLQHTIYLNCQKYINEEDNIIKNRFEIIDF
jgi:hypothetical protein